MRACGLLVLVAVGRAYGAPPAVAEEKTVRCAVIGGMVSTGMWEELAKRFEAATGYRAEVTVSGNKDVIAPAMRRGEVDLITMHSSDAIINLVADGYAIDPQPWARNDHVIVGPVDDPAKIRGLTDAGEAIGRVIAAKARFVIPHGTGAQEVLRDAAGPQGAKLDETAALHAPEGPEIARYAASQHAYTLVGRIPFTNGKMDAAGLVVMVEGDARLRRPYLVAVANPKRWPKARAKGAVRLAAFLREEATQEWLGKFATGGGKRPLFFPVGR